MGVKHVEFVGHPLAGEVKARYGREEFCKLHELDPSKPIISLLPGSRHKEVERILPPMLDAATIVNKERSDVQFVIVVAPSRSLEEVERIKERYSVPGLKITRGETREALAASDAAAVASGTATLEASFFGTPMVIVYKESFLNWHILGSLINTEHYGLVNLIAGERVVTELMQNDLNGPRLAKELVGLLDKKRNSTLRGRLEEISSRLGSGGASERAATGVLRELGE